MQPQSSKSTGRKSRSTKTCGRSRQPATTALTSSAEDFHAKTSALPEKVLALPVQGPVFGASSLGSLASYDPATSSWRTSQLSLLEGPMLFSGRWPRSGMTRNGTLFQLQPLVRRTGGSESGSSAFAAGLVRKPTHHVPTPTASDHIKRKSTSSEALNYETNKTVSLDRWVRMWPTPRTTDVQAGRGCVQIGNGLYRPSKALAAGRLVGGANLADAVQMWPTPTTKANQGAP